MTMATTGTPFAVGLHDEAACDPILAGSKAATLARLASKGFPVPAGFVVTTAAIQRVLAGNGTDDGSPPSFPMHGDVWDEIATALAELGDQPLAVRSSGVAEDLAGASYAGQYESVLNVRGPQALAGAIARCVASAGSARVRAYAGDGARTSPLAVLIQQMIPAQAAGVAFTANPVSGDDEILVSAVRGLGDRLVSGLATPDEWIVRGDETTCRGALEDALTPDQVRDVAGLAQQVADVAGAAQDVEWAIAGADLFVLQARPITGVPVKPDLEVPTEGFWTKDASHFPVPATPFGASVFMPMLGAASQSWSDAGMLFQELQFRSLGGEVYSHVIPIGGKERPLPPSWVMWVLTRALPEMRRRGRAAERTLELSRTGQSFDRWETEWRGVFRDEAAGYRAVDLEALSNEALLAHLARVTDFLNRGERLHLHLQMYVALALIELVDTCEQSLGWDSLATLALVTGHSEASSEPGRALDALAREFARHAAVGTVLAGAGDDVVARLGEVAPSAATALSAYLEHYGHRTLNYDPGDVTLFERPGLVAGLIRDRMRVARDDAPTGRPADDAADRARAMLASRPVGERARFEQALPRAQRAYGCREDNIFWLDMLPCALIRYAMVEAGRRLAGRGVLATATDAAFLEEREVREALSSGSTQDLRPLVARRKAERAWVIAHPGPLTYGPDPGPPPDMSALPAALGHLNGALIRWLGLMYGPSTPGGGAGRVTGVPASSGMYTGTVRVVRDESEFGRLQPGDVLVCPITTPSWSVLFLRAGAVVADAGGVVAHTAVIAREYGIPAVLATGDGTKRLHDGDVVTVDGSAGTVSIES